MTFLESHTVDVRHKLVGLLVCGDGNEVGLKLRMFPMEQKIKFNLLSMEHMKNE